MDLISQPLPPSDAVKMLAAKKLLPTTMTTAQLRALNAETLRRASFSAQTTITELLQIYKDLVGEIATPTTELREDRQTAANPTGQTNVAPSVASAREQIQDFFKSIDFKPAAGTEGTLLDLSSFPRIMLKLTTDLATTFGAGRHVRQNSDPDVVDAYPGLSLERVALPKGGVAAERDWPERWVAACENAGDEDALRAFKTTGKMIALKSSGMWQALGDGAGGYDDTLGNPFDPLAFNTHMRQFEQERAVMERLGFLDEGEKAEPSPLDLTNLFKEAA